LKTPGEVIAFARENGIRVIDFRFVDLPGIWQHFSIPVRNLTEELFEDGLGFDGSSIRGFKEIHESDMILIPDARTAFVDVFTQEPTLNILCDVHDPITRQPYTRDPRYIARRAEEYLSSTGIADTAYFGPEAEFYIFDDVRFGTTTHSAFYALDSCEAAWNTGRDEQPNLGYKIRYKEGYFPVPPVDHFADLRDGIWIHPSATETFNEVLGALV